MGFVVAFVVALVAFLRSLIPACLAESRFVVAFVVDLLLAGARIGGYSFYRGESTGMAQSEQIT